MRHDKEKVSGQSISGVVCGRSEIIQTHTTRNYYTLAFLTSNFIGEGKINLDLLIEQTLKKLTRAFKKSIIPNFPSHEITVREALAFHYLQEALRKIVEESTISGKHKTQKEYKILIYFPTMTTINLSKI
ncbi:hypothetical protein ACJX0J_021973, partial [Zea mays]